MDVVSSIRLFKTGLNLILFFCFCTSFAQNTNSNNELILFTKNLELNNAALSDTTSAIKIGNQSFVGDLSGVRTFYASGNFAFKHVNNSHSLIGASVLNGQYGPLINDVQVRFRYVYRLHVTNDIEATVGAEIGFVNVFFVSTANTDGGSSLAPDINVTTALFGKQWKLGASLNHLTNPLVQPISEQFRYNRNLNIYGEYTFPVSYQINFVPAFQSIFSGLNYQYRTNFAAVYNDLVEVGIGIRNEGFTLNGGIKKLNFKPFDLSIHAGYRLPKRNNSLNNTHLFQIHLGIIF